ncbi:MAG TPA: SagB/ThcOx family dehydrogenase [Bacteroidales bacterium]|nr:SagB/ThcOx family dehydrogenase [Bacteroidales bacterium]
MKKIIISMLTIVSISFGVIAQDISLPAPDKKGGIPLMQALSQRQTTRSFTDDKLTQQQLSDMLWAAWGINRADLKKRTAPSAMNYQEIDMYVAMASGLYLYIPESHSLRMINNKDLRKTTGTQSYVNNAALNIVYVADMGKAGKKEGVKIDDSDLFMSYSDAAFIAQNVYLYCASANLGCVVRGSIPKDKLAPEMGLRSNQFIILAQTVGYAKK